MLAEKRKQENDCNNTIMPTIIEVNIFKFA